MDISLLWEKRYMRPKSSILLKDKTLATLSLKLWTKRCLPFNIVLERSNVIRQVKENGGLNIEKEVMSTLPLFAKDIIIYLENLRELIFLK